MSEYHILIIEAFYGGSHKVLIDVLIEHLNNCGLPLTLVTLSAKKWHWRARCGALQMYSKIPAVPTNGVLWCSSVVNLAELLGLRPDLHRLKKVIYFHENQLIYPVQKIRERDIQYSYNQIISCLCADEIFFNSEFNKTSFLESINKVIKLIPGYKPKDTKTRIETKSRVLYFPLVFPKDITHYRSENILHIVWPHRWEFDKGPEDFFNILFKLNENGLKFHVSVLGEIYKDVPKIFTEAKEILGDKIVHFGFVESKSNYYKILSSCHVVVSTAKHEFFGVSVMEAAYCGCLPLLPNQLVYPEIYPTPCLYSDFQELYEILKQYCLKPSKATDLRETLDINLNRFSAENLLPDYLRIIKSTTNLLPNSE